MREGVHVVLAGEVAEWPGISAVAAAHDGESWHVGGAQQQRAAGSAFAMFTASLTCSVGSSSRSNRALSSMAV